MLPVTMSGKNFLTNASNSASIARLNECSLKKSSATRHSSNGGSRVLVWFMVNRFSACAVSNQKTINMSQSQRRGFFVLGTLVVCLLACWRLGVLASWRAHVLASWRLGMLTCWRLGVLACWRVGVLACWRAGVVASLRLGVLAC